MTEEKEMVHRVIMDAAESWVMDALEGKKRGSSFSGLASYGRALGLIEMALHLDAISWEEYEEYRSLINRKIRPSKQGIRLRKIVHR